MKKNSLSNQAFDAVIGVSKQQKQQITHPTVIPDGTQQSFSTISSEQAITFQIGSHGWAWWWKV